MSTIEIQKAKSNGWYLEYIAGNGIDGEVWKNDNISVPVCFPENVPLETLIEMTKLYATNNNSTNGH